MSTMVCHIFSGTVRFLTCGCTSFVLISSWHLPWQLQRKWWMLTAAFITRYIKLPSWSGDFTLENRSRTQWVWYLHGPYHFVSAWNTQISAHGHLRIVSSFLSFDLGLKALVHPTCISSRFYYLHHTAVVRLRSVILRSPVTSCVLSCPKVSNAHILAIFFLPSVPFHTVLKMLLYRNMQGTSIK